MLSLSGFELYSRWMYPGARGFHARFPVSVTSFGRTLAGLWPTKRSSPTHARKNLWYPGYVGCPWLLFFSLTVHSGCKDPSQATTRLVYCTCEQDTEERHWGQQFHQIKRETSGPVKVHHLKYSGRTKQKSFVLWDL